MVIAIAEGRLDPIIMEAFDEFPQIPSLLEHPVVYANETVLLESQSRESKAKKDSSPFVLLSEKTFSRRVLCTDWRGAFARSDIYSTQEGREQHKVRSQ